MAFTPEEIEMIREMKRELASTAVMPCQQGKYFAIVHPRASRMVWQLGAYKFAVTMWLQTFRYLTLAEWWGDRPWNTL